MLKLFIILQLILIGRKDWYTKRISNKDILWLLFFVVLYSEQTDVMTNREKWLGMLIVSLPMLCITLLVPGSFGGGDIKLMMVCGRLLGISGIWNAFLCALVCASVYACWLLVNKKGRKAELAFGPFLCFGILSVFLEIF